MIYMVENIDNWAICPKYFLIVKVGITNFDEMSMGIFVSTALFIGIEPSNIVCYNNDSCSQATT